MLANQYIYIYIHQGDPSLVQTTGTICTPVVFIGPSQILVDPYPMFKAKVVSFRRPQVVAQVVLVKYLEPMVFF